jgi:hypothetical protein
MQSPSPFAAVHPRGLDPPSSPPCVSIMLS